MARYIKANQKVVQYLHLENDRNQVKDGNYLLWQADMLAFGRLTDLPQILKQIGGIALAAYEARQEQDGTVTRELPTATDERFVIKMDETETKQPEETEPGEVEQPETGTEPEPEQPVEGESTEQPEEEPTENDGKAETNNEETEVQL